MTKESLLTEIYLSKEVDEILLKYTEAYLRDDIKQHVFLVLFEKEEAFIMDLHNRAKLKHYVVKILFNTINFKSDKGLFVRQSGRGKEIPTEHFHCTPDEDGSQYEEMIQECQDATRAVYWYNRTLLELYAKEGNYRAVSEKTGIPLKSVYNAIDKARQEIKKKML
jgi:DNA-directed RNA polymerase specialized sigma24 family protein